MTLIRTLLTTSLLAASIGAAQAQTSPVAPMMAPTAAPMPGGMPMGAAGGPGMGGEMGRMMDGMMPMMSMMRMMMAPEHIEGRLAFQKTELKITDAQLPQWNALADVMRKNAKAVSEARGTMMHKSVTLSAPDRQDQDVQRLTAQLETTKASSSAVRALYAVLNETQKKTADELLAPAMGHM